MSGESVKKTFYEDKFLGINLRFDPDKIPDGFSPLAVNVDLTRMKTLRKRMGTELAGKAFDGEQRIQSIMELTSPMGQKQAFIVRGGNILKYDYQDNAWVNLHLNALVPEIDVASVVYKNKVYMTSISDNLTTTDGTTLAPVGIIENRIKGKCLAVGQRTLFIGNVNFNNTSYPDRVYYSKFNIDNRTEGDEFWESTEVGVDGSIINSTRFFRVEGGNVRAIKSFANRDRVYIFSDTKCYAFDVDQAEVNPFGALSEIFPIGCAGQNAVSVVAGVMYWMDNNAKIYAWTGGTTRPEEISFSIDDEGLGNSIVSSIDKSEENLDLISAFGVSKQLYFSVGSIQVSDRVLKNACIKIFLSQNGLSSYMSIDTFPQRILKGELLRIGNENRLALGGYSNIVLTKGGLNDVNTDNSQIAIDCFYRTKSYNFGYPLHMKQINNIFVQFRPQRNDARLDIKVRTANNTAYIPISGNEALDKFGIFNMKEMSSGQRQAIRKINLPTEAKAENVSFEFSNKEIDQTFEIYGFGSMEVNITPLDVSIE